MSCRWARASRSGPAWPHRNESSGSSVSSETLGRRARARVTQCVCRSITRRRAELLVFGTQDSCLVLKESFQNTCMLAIAEGIQGSRLERIECTFEGRQTSRPVRDCRRKSKHGRASLASSAMQRRQDGGVLLREAFHLRLERCCALRVKAILQRQSRRRFFECTNYASRPPEPYGLRRCRPARSLARSRRAASSKESDVLAAPTMLTQTN